MENKLGDLSHLFVTVFLSSLCRVMVIPAITDVTMSALCPGQDECSLAIYLSGVQQAVVGAGSVVLTPLIGNLSDKYGRKALLTLPMALSIIPLVTLACSRTTNFFYAYYVLRTITATVSDGSITCLANAYVADIVSERQRTSAFGVLSGVVYAAFVFGTLATRFLSTALTFQFAASASILGVIYMRIFLKESLPVGENCLTEPILKRGQGDTGDAGDLPAKQLELKTIPSLGDLISLLRTSPTFSQAAVVAFFNGLAVGGAEASLMYFLKARFHFNKNQYADLMLIVSVAATVSQLIFMPLVAPLLPEEKLLSLGLLVGVTNCLLYSISWSYWVPYAISVLSIFVAFVPPCLLSIASKQVGPHEQGKAQGCIQGLISLANIISPLIFSPLTGL
uniref:Hippocampus abundant transcript-like protein 1 n=1 Tax=Rhizophora mucronata TaxID=61149 RepID=A0A2P2LF74_RHIMU